MPLKTREELESIAMRIYDYIEFGDSDDKQLALQLLDSLQVEAMRYAAAVVVENCCVCNGRGFTETTGYGHACGGDDSLCQTQCPVPVQEQEQCEYCGRPTAAIETAIENREKI